MNKPTKKQIQKWVLALRSTEYSQTHDVLQDENGHCCLGVACELFIPRSLQQRYAEGYLTGTVAHHQNHAPMWLRNLSTIFGSEISGLNDTGHVRPGDDTNTFFEKHERFTFDEIADLIEYEYIEGVEV